MKLRERMGQAPWGVRVILLAAVLGVAGAGLGVWWLPALAGGVFGLVSARRGRIGAVTIPFLAGVLAWGGLVVLAWTRGGAVRVVDALAGVFGVPTWAMWLLPPLYAGLLAGSAALLASSFRQPRGAADA